MAQAQVTLTEKARDPSSAKFDNFQTKYLDDSLCILQMNFTAKNGFGNEIGRPMEYYYIRAKGKFYEAYQKFSGDGAIFCTEEQYDKKKIGKIYENLPYRQGLRYLVTIFTNAKGREAGNKESVPFSIDVSTGTGQWELQTYKDEFGEEGKEKYLSLSGNGVFSNYATTGAEMSALLFIEKGGFFSFTIIEYSSSMVKSDDLYLYHIKDSEGKVFDMRLYNNSSSGRMISLNPSDNAIMSKILNKGGVITVSVTEPGTPRSYLFKMDVAGFDKAIQYL